MDNTAPEVHGRHRIPTTVLRGHLPELRPESCYYSRVASLYCDFDRREKELCVVGNVDDASVVDDDDAAGNESGK